MVVSIFFKPYILCKFSFYFLAIIYSIITDRGFYAHRPGFTRAVVGLELVLRLQNLMRAIIKLSSTATASPKKGLLENREKLFGGTVPPNKT